MWNMLIYIDLLADFEFFDPFAKGGSGDSEESRCFDLVASSFFEGLFDEFAFHRGNEGVVWV